MIVMNKVSKTFDEGKTFVVKEVSLEVCDGQTLVLLGSSGCGKTTTLKMINRLIDCTSGEIQLDGQDIMAMDIVKLRRSIGYVFQGVGLFPHMTVSQNIAIVMRLNGVEKKQRRARSQELLACVNLDPTVYAQRYPHELSGGQRQRVGVARALATNPKYLLMDEPFGALDAITRADMQDELAELRTRLNKTMVFVTHDLFEALRLGDTIAVMNQGKIEQVGTGAELINSPKTDFVKDLMQKPRDQLLAFTEHVDD